MNENWQQTESGSVCTLCQETAERSLQRRIRIVGIKEEKTRKKQLLDNKKYVNT